MFNFKLTPGALCLVEEDETDCINDKAIPGGTPVRVISIQELDCPARVDGECKAPCGALCNNDNKCSAYTVTVEEANGHQWDISCFPEDVDDTWPLEILGESKAEYLLSKEAYRQYKLCEFTDDGLTAKTQPLLIGIGAILLTYAITYVIQNVGEWTGWMLLALSGFVFLFGLVKYIAGNIYMRHELSTAEQYFFDNQETNKKALEALLKKTSSNP